MVYYKNIDIIPQCEHFYYQKVSKINKSVFFLPFIKVTFIKYPHYM